MNLKQFAIHRTFQKVTASNQMVIGEDYSLPEGKPDILKILQKKSEVRVAEVRAEKGKIRIKGTFALWVLYLAQRSEEAAACLEMEFPFEEILYMEDAANGDQLSVRWETEELKVTMIHPGKLGIHALVTLHGEIVADEECMITEDVEEEKNLFSKTESMTMADPVVNRKETYTVRQEVALPANKANVDNILWKELQLRNPELRLQEGRVAVKGEMLLFVLYQGEEEDGNTKIQWLEQALPFQGVLEVPGVTAECFGSMEVETAGQKIEVKPDYDGEMRLLLGEMNIEISMQLYSQRDCRILKDAYSIVDEVELKTEEVVCEKLRMHQETVCKVQGVEQIEPDLGIEKVLGHQAVLKNSSVKMTDRGLLWEGLLEVQILYLTEDREEPLGNVWMQLPCSQLIEVPNKKTEDRWKLHPLIEQVVIDIQQPDQLRFRGEIGLRLCVMEQIAVKNVTEIEQKSPDSEKCKKGPSMTIHFVQQGETMWTLAKKNRMPVEELKAMNELTGEVLTPGQKLLLLKKSPEEIVLEGSNWEK